jgi:hypothetical protein
MKVSEHLKFSSSGFSPRRVAFAAVVLSFATIPLHLSDNWRVSEVAFGFSLFLLLVSGLFCFTQPRGTPKRFHPVAWALFAFVAHMFSTHL